MITGLCLYLSWLTDFQQAMWASLLLAPYVIYTLFQPQRHGDTEKPAKLRVSVSLWFVLIMLVAFITPALFAPLHS